LIGDSGSWHWADLLSRPRPAILNPANPAPPVVRRLRRLRRLRLFTTGHHDCRSTGQDDCRRPDACHSGRRTANGSSGSIAGPYERPLTGPRSCGSAATTPPVG